MKIKIILILLISQVVFSQDKTCYYVKNIDLFYIISFQENSSAIIESDLKLERIFNGLIEYPQMTIEVLGHCDFNEKSKKQLSLKRSMAVINFLVKKGIKRKRLNPKSFSDKLLTNNCNTINCNEEEKSKNRRVEFVVTAI